MRMATYQESHESHEWCEFSKSHDRPSELATTWFPDPPRIRTARAWHNQLPGASHNQFSGSAAHRLDSSTGHETVELRDTPTCSQMSTTEQQGYQHTEQPTNPQSLLYEWNPRTCVLYVTAGTYDLEAAALFKETLPSSSAMERLFELLVEHALNKLQLNEWVWFETPLWTWLQTAKTIYIC